MSPRAAADYLRGLVHSKPSRASKDAPLRRMASLVSALGDPQRSFPTIHVTGTNGKGSATCMAAALLQALGLRVGTYTSPHLENLGERVAINGRPSDESAMALAIGRVADAAARIALTPTWFEAVTAAGLWLLSVHAVDVGVIEVGMLGRRDATNVVTGEVAVLTNVAFDHTDVAGPSREAIAWEKAGIIKPNTTLILGERDLGLGPVFDAARPKRTVTQGDGATWRHRQATQDGCVVDLLTPWGHRRSVHLAAIGEHQCDNALLALSAVEALTDRAMDRDMVDRTLGATKIAGRFEIALSEPTVILDGAHNAAAAATLRRTLEERFPDTTRVAVFSAPAGRDPFEFLAAIGAESFELVVVTEPPSSHTLPASVVASGARRVGISARAVAEPRRALEHALTTAGVHGLVIVTGSMYLVGALRLAMTTDACPATWVSTVAA
jgi:dihydrofolate synthase/folylpolyglutamate synthase